MVGAMKATKRFYIEPDGTVTDVGFRPKLAEESPNYNVSVCPKNIEVDGRRKVEVIVLGEIENIERFRRDVESGKLKPPSATNYSVTELEDYNGITDFNYCLNTLTLGQMSKFIEVGQKGFDGLSGKIDELGRKIENGFENLPERIARAMKESK